MNEASDRAHRYAICRAIAAYQFWEPDPNPVERWKQWARTQVKLGRLTVEELAIASMAVQQIINENSPQTR